MSLMDDFELGKLKNGWYWVLTPDSVKPFPAFCFRRKFDGCDGELNDCISDVIASCNYEELQQLKEENANLQVSSYSLRKLDKITQRTHDKEAEKFLALLKECKPYIQKEMETIKGAGFYNCDWVWKVSDLLTRINAAIGESEGKC